jgi:hypothetical protein
MVNIYKISYSGNVISYYMYCDICSVINFETEDFMWTNAFEIN